MGCWFTAWSPSPQGDIRTGSDVSHPWVDSGIAQNRVLSPKLFNLSVNSLAATISEVRLISCSDFKLSNHYLLTTWSSKKPFWLKLAQTFPCFRGIGRIWSLRCFRSITDAEFPSLATDWSSAEDGGFTKICSTRLGFECC